MATAKCKQCKTQIPNKSIYIEQDVNKKDGTVDKKRLYFCCDECKTEYESKQRMIEEEKKNKQKSARVQLTDLIKALYESSGIGDINWGCEGNRIELIKKGNPELKMTDEGVMKCLKYIVDVKMIDVFDNNGGSILNLVPYYYAESTNYEKQLKFVDDLIKKCKELGYKPKEKDKSDLLSSLQRIMRKNKEYKIATLEYMVEYLTNIKEYSLFNDERITILGAIEYNYHEAKDFYIKCEEIKKLAKEFDFSNNVKIVKVGNREKKVDYMSFD